ncbi:hypothetical protein FL966_02440 [Caproiciproducens galactitolivorans]|uniref:Alanine--tRNA ligase n=1 Tax=Caproiciproducens galactitolivorans TaxID=642589 RepID=A0A4Z0Y7V5_9FIRM|nr:alanine--tRNA ligase-related protein [Caproiciproducens galactitolivorans]QEY33996.1 hypothetical protein FL966_02440 [Caproiciproducens galactitolivorans]TGJ76038.1 alanine--tRNA ligase [Caproiciproducens galactitolivorans]
MEQETEKLYYQNTYLRTFTAKVLKCERQENVYHVVLNRTAFYPEGGGQPADTGVINTVNVLDVQEKKGIIIHKTDRPLAVGSSVRCGINWPRRFSLMQQHSGEHIVSGLVHRFYHLDNVGFHMGAKAITVDFNGELGENDLALVERLANEAVFRNIEIKTDCPSEEELAVLDYRSKKELTGKVRIVTVPGYDACACCGTHVVRTGEIGVIKIMSAQRYKGGTRVSMLCGDRAVADYNEKEKSVGAVSVLLSAKPEEIGQAVERVLEENASLKKQLAEIRHRMLAEQAESVPEGTKNLCLFEENLTPNDLRTFCLLLCERCSGIAAVFSGDETQGYKYAIGSTSEDVRPFIKEFNKALNGRGGGSKGLVQGTVKGSQKEIHRFIRRSFENM